MSQAEHRSTVSDAVRKHKEFLFPAVATYYQEPIAIVKGEGEYVWDDQGNRYLDCFGGVLTVSVGHAEPRVNKAWIDQVNTVAHTSTLYANGPQGDLAEKLAEISPGQSEEIVLYQQRHRGRRHGDPCGKARDGPQRGRRSAAQLCGPLGDRAFDHRAFDLEADRVAGAGHRSRPRAVLLSLPVQRDARQLRPRVCERCRGADPNDDDRRDRGVYGRDDPRRRRFYRAAEGLFQARSRDHAKITAGFLSPTKCRPPGAARATSGSASSITASSRTSSPRPREWATACRSAGRSRRPRWPTRSRA